MSGQYLRTSGPTTRSTQRSYTSLEEKALDQAFAVTNPAGYSLRDRAPKVTPVTAAPTKKGSVNKPPAAKTPAARKGGRPSRARSAPGKGSKVTASRKAACKNQIAADDLDSSYDNLSEGHTPKAPKPRKKIVLPRCKSLPPSHTWKHMDKPSVQPQGEPDSDAEVDPKNKPVKTNGQQKAKTGNNKKQSAKKPAAKDAKPVIKVADKTKK